VVRLVRNKRAEQGEASIYRIVHRCHEFEMRLNSSAARSFTSQGFVARSSAAAHGGETCHLHGYNDVVNWSLAWRDQESWQPPKCPPLGHVVGKWAQ
jgi:hypothetical protein